MQRLPLRGLAHLDARVASAAGWVERAPGSPGGGGGGNQKKGVGLEQKVRDTPDMNENVRTNINQASYARIVPHLPYHHNNIHASSSALGTHLVYGLGFVSCRLGGENNMCAFEGIREDLLGPDKLCSKLEGVPPLLVFEGTTLGLPLRNMYPRKAPTGTTKRGFRNLDSAHLDSAHLSWVLGSRWRCDTMQIRVLAFAFGPHHQNIQNLFKGGPISVVLNPVSAKEKHGLCFASAA